MHTYAHIVRASTKANNKLETVLSKLTVEGSGSVSDNTRQVRSRLGLGSVAFDNEEFRCFEFACAPNPIWSIDRKEVLQRTVDDAVSKEQEAAHAHTLQVGCNFHHEVSPTTS